jgi:putative methionine-R-sulfoxide reductase with GAF domain
MISNGEVIGVLDIDSTSTDTFNETDKEYLEQIVKKIIETIV